MGEQVASVSIPIVGGYSNYFTGRGGRSGKSITFFTGDKHERALAGELARVLRESGFDAEGLKKFPMTIKKKTHSVYGAFFRDDVDMSAVPTRIVFDD